MHLRYSPRKWSTLQRYIQTILLSEPTLQNILGLKRYNVLRLYFVLNQTPPIIKDIQKMCNFCKNIKFLPCRRSIMQNIYIWVFKSFLVLLRTFCHTWVALAWRNMLKYRFRLTNETLRHKINISHATRREEKKNFLSSIWIGNLNGYVLVRTFSRSLRLFPPKVNQSTKKIQQRKSSNQETSLLTYYLFQFQTNYVIIFNAVFVLFFLRFNSCILSTEKYPKDVSEIIIASE